jgi:guanylate kinase
MDKQTLITRAQALVADYHANDAVLAQLSAVTLLAVVGPSGAGKSTISRRTGLPYVIGDTTRAMREGEMQGVDYNFRTNFEEVLNEIEAGEYVQFVIQRGSEIYGTKASSFPSSGACTMSVLASAVQDFYELGFGKVLPVYIVPPDYSEWMHRLSAHRDKDLEARLVEAKESLTLALADSRYVFILNDDMDTAVTALKNVANGKVDANSSARARTVANTVYEHLQKVIR